MPAQCIFRNSVDSFMQVKNIYFLIFKIKFSSSIRLSELWQITTILTLITSCNYASDNNRYILEGGIKNDIFLQHDV